MPDTDETRPEPEKFDFTAFPENTLIFDRREGIDRRDRRATPPPGLEGEALPEAEAKRPPERRERKERRRRVDPTTFEKQYTEDEIEFMNAVQSYKNQSGKSFPSHGDILRIAARLGYRKGFDVEEDSGEEDSTSREVQPCLPV